jgi:uncharacterized membrane protein
VWASVLAGKSKHQKRVEKIKDREKGSLRSSLLVLYLLLPVLLVLLVLPVPLILSFFFLPLSFFILLVVRSLTPFSSNFLSMFFAEYPNLSGFVRIHCGVAEAKADDIVTRLSA